MVEDQDNMSAQRSHSAVDRAEFRNPDAEELPAPKKQHGDDNLFGSNGRSEAESQRDPIEAQQNRPRLRQGAASHDEKSEAASVQDDRTEASTSKRHSLSGWIIFCLLMLGTGFTASLALARATYHPRTDDVEILADFIGMAPQVEGPITELPIHDNEFVKAGQLLFVVDERPYRFALERALSQQASLEGQIEDRQRSIRSQVSGVRAANATILSSASNRDAMAADITQAQADVSDAKAAVLRAEADRQYAADNLHRLEPLLAQQYVTVDQVDQARTSLEVRTRTVQQAESQVALAVARVSSNLAHYEQSSADVEQRRAQRDQAAAAVQTLAPLANQREERAAEMRNAKYNLGNCKVYAPFDGYVTNLTISLGQYVRPGVQVFTMIDSRKWWALANFRETQLKHISF